MRRGFSIITPRLQLRALHVCSADQCRSSHGLHCGEADLHPKANRFFPLFLSLSSSLSLPVFILHLIAVLSRLSPPTRSGPPSLPIRLSRYRRGEREREREGEECGWMWTTCRQSASKVFSRSFSNSLAADWVSITRIPALLSVAVWIREAGEERQTMRNAIGLRCSAKDFHT